ncbi:MAG TPA: hypothetical protein VFO52_03955 [Longimicrobiales bacterium]|nr:hypothetical protein [Longimicrobiales bacterium]
MKKNTLDAFQDGAISGFIGYLLLSIYFAVVNLAVGKPAWHTLEALGNALFGTGSPGPLIAYNGLHLAIFLVLGVAAAFLILEIERHPAFWYALFFVFVAGVMVGYILLITIAGPIAGVRPVSMVVGNAIAATGMGSYLFWRHPALTRIVHDEVERDDLEYHPVI